MTEESKQNQDQQTEPSIIVEGVLPDTNVVQARQCYSPEGVAPSCVAGEGTGSRTKIVEITTEEPRDPNAPIMWPSLNGPTEIKEGDGVVPSRPYSTRKSVLDGISFGIAATATPAVAVKEDSTAKPRAIPEIAEGEVVAIQNPGFSHLGQGEPGFKTDGTSFTLRAQIPDGVMYREREDLSEDLPDIPEGGCAPMLTPGREVKRQNGRRFKEDGEESFTLTAADKHGIATRDEGKLRIRYLTPVECFRLMGFTDDEIAKMMAVEQSKSRLYKMAGNSIVVDVLAAIFHNIYIEPTFERGAKVKTLDDFFGGNRCPEQSGTRTAT